MRFRTAKVGAAALMAVTAGLALSACSSPGRPFGPTVGDVVGGGGGGTSPVASGAQTGIGVNAYLWRATLDTLSFMPLTGADPWGGVVNYDWYSDPATPNERFKATVFILDTRLRADALNVSLVKQVRDASGEWVAASVDPQTETDLENAILTKARQFNLADAR